MFHVCAFAHVAEKAVNGVSLVKYVFFEVHFAFSLLSRVQLPLSFEKRQKRSVA